MAAAWEQVGDVLEANARMRRAQARAAGRVRLAPRAPRADGRAQRRRGARADRAGRTRA